MTPVRTGTPLLRLARTALCVAGVAAVAVFHVWSHTRVTSAGYRLGELQRQGQALRAERDRLEVEVATLRAPGRLEAFARSRLGMAPPAPGAVVSPGSASALAGAAIPPPAGRATGAAPGSRLVAAGTVASNANVLRAPGAAN